jgi:integrase
MYAGLRRGELQALAWDDVDLATNTIQVQRSYDAAAQTVILPKSHAGSRTVPIASELRAYLVERKRSHRWAERRRDGLVFGRTETRPFNASSVSGRARSAWLAADLEPIGLHECRHTFASLMIAAGVNVKALATFMGHASITITLDRYGHMHSGQREPSRPTARRLPLPGICQGYLSRKAPQTIPLAVRCN